MKKTVLSERPLLFFRFKHYAFLSVLATTLRMRAGRLFPKLPKNVLPFLVRLSPLPILNLFVDYG